MEPTNNEESDDDEYSFLDVAYTQSFLVPQEALEQEGYEGEFMDGPAYKPTMAKKTEYSKQQINRLRGSKKQLLNSTCQFSIVSSNEPMKNDDSHKPYNIEESDEFQVDYEDENIIEEVSPSAHMENINKSCRSILPNNMIDKNEVSAFVNEYSFIDIRQSEVNELPVKPENTNAYSEIKGAFFEGLTNINYYLHDKGVYGLLGIKTLDLDDKNLKRMLFNKEYQYYQKENFLSEFGKIIWFTYRNNFEGLLNRKAFLKITDFHKEIALHENRKIYKSDNGWGCMIRVAQMITARVLYLLENDLKVLPIDEHHFDDDDNVTRSSVYNIKEETDKKDIKKRSVIRLFLDNFRDFDSPYSIQNFVEHAFLKDRKLPGEWYGANSASIIIEKLNTYYKPNKYLEVVVFNDRGIKEKE
jgi:hypothetical protein